VRGKMRFHVKCRPAFDYGRAEHTAESHFFGVLFTSPGCTMALESSTELAIDGGGAVAEFELEAGESTTFVLEHVADSDYHPHGHSSAETLGLFEETVSYWRNWLAQSTYRGRWREMVNRSALTLKLLTYHPTGAIIAAPTTSLPEQVGGPRNWDYRYVWIRDAAFSLYALLRLGFKAEAEAFMGWLMDRFRESESDGESGPLQIMYAVDGARDLPEEELDHLEGYRGSAPVRIGNGAADQLQLDIYGELIDSVYLYDRHGDRIVSESWRDLERVIAWIGENWDQPDEGIWETRGGRQRFTYSRLMCWVALDRAVRIARDRGLPGDIVAWMRCRDQIYERIMDRGWDEDRQAFVQHEDNTVLDASLLMMPLVKFVAPKDPRWLSTLDAIGEELVSDSLVYRYNVEASPDGLRGDEGTFSICSFWYVEALARAGRLAEARLAFEKMLTYANHVGLFSEEIGPTGELLGNFPQAFTHLSLISAAVNLDYLLG
jgi:GH15 family glucan-1,4-alpha-glucosidase